MSFACPTFVDVLSEATSRRQQFLQSCWPTLGPTQREHVTTHCQAVSKLAYRLGVTMYLPAEMLTRVRLAGLLHDIGKVAVPEAILAKAGPLTAAQRQIVNQHAWLGARYTLAVAGDVKLARIVALHHRRGAAGAMPLEAAIVQAADALDSMMSNRPYALARSPAQALAELDRCAPSQFDPRVVRAAQVWGVAA
jgi:putative nucleotidyltransferase with HDIG domain